MCVLYIFIGFVEFFIKNLTLLEQLLYILIDFVEFCIKNLTLLEQA